MWPAQSATSQTRPQSAGPGASGPADAGSAVLLAAALAGDEQALARLVDRLTPVIQARVARAVLARLGGGAASGVRSQVEDLTQEVFLLLFAERGRVLRTWQPERGLSLENFVGLVACRRAISLLRTGRSEAWTQDPTFDEVQEEPSPEADPETQAASRQELRLLLERLREELSPLGWRLFDLLLIRGRGVEEVERATGMSRDALYAWRSRLRHLARRLRQELRSEIGAERRIDGEEGA